MLSWGALGALLEALGGPLGGSWGPLEAILEPFRALLGLSWGPLGALLGLSWGPLGGLEGPLGAIDQKEEGFLISVPPSEP